MSDAVNDYVEQLRQYATSGSEDSLGTVVHRFLPLVYAAALRRVVGNSHQAEDVAQMVFTALARNASTLAKHPHLTGWIYTTTRFLAVKTMRGERRRLAHEHVASLDHAAMNDDQPERSPLRCTPCSTMTWGLAH